MKDLVLYQFYLLGRIGIIYRLYLSYYHLAVRVIKFLLGRLAWVDAAYIKGSFGKSYFAPVVSDIDIFIVGKANSQNLKKLKKLFKRLSFLFPILKDFDFYSLEEAKFLWGFGDLKFRNAKQWTLIKGSPIETDYYYHPLKYSIDLVQEIHFQKEWLFRNLKTRKKGDMFFSLKLNRQYNKVVSLLGKFEDHSLSETKLKVSKLAREWENYSSEEIISKFDELVLRSKSIVNLQKCLELSLKQFDWKTITSNEYFLKELCLLRPGFKFNAQLHYYSEHLFKLYYFLGCIDSYQLYKWSVSTNLKSEQLILEMVYWAKVLEARENQFHKKSDAQKIILGQAFSPNSSLHADSIISGASRSTVVRVFENGQTPKEADVDLLNTLDEQVRVIDILDSSIVVPLSLKPLGREYAAVYASRSDNNSETLISLLDEGLSWAFGSEDIFVFTSDMPLVKNILTEINNSFSQDLLIIRYFGEVQQPWAFGIKANFVKYVNLRQPVGWNKLPGEVIRYQISKKFPDMSIRDIILKTESRRFGVCGEQGFLKQHLDALTYKGRKNLSSFEGIDSDTFNSFSKSFEENQLLNLLSLRQPFNCSKSKILVSCHNKGDAKISVISDWDICFRVKSGGRFVIDCQTEGFSYKERLFQVTYKMETIYFKKTPFELNLVENDSVVVSLCGFSYEGEIKLKNREPNKAYYSADQSFTFSIPIEISYQVNLPVHCLIEIYSYTWFKNSHLALINEEGECVSELVSNSETAYLNYFPEKPYEKLTVVVTSFVEPGFEYGIEVKRIFNLKEKGELQYLERNLRGLKAGFYKIVFKGASHSKGHVRVIGDKTSFPVIHFNNDPNPSYEFFLSEFTVFLEITGSLNFDSYDLLYSEDIQDFVDKVDL